MQPSELLKLHTVNVLFKSSHNIVYGGECPTGVYIQQSHYTTSNTSGFWNKGLTCQYQLTVSSVEGIM